MVDEDYAATVMMVVMVMVVMMVMTLHINDGKNNVAMDAVDAMTFNKTPNFQTFQTSKVWPIQTSKLPNIGAALEVAKLPNFQTFKRPRGC